MTKTTIDGYVVELDPVNLEHSYVTREINGRGYGARLRNLLRDNEIVCPTSGLGSDWRHTVSLETVDKIYEWVDQKTSHEHEHSEDDGESESAPLP